MNRYANYPQGNFRSTSMIWQKPSNQNNESRKCGVLLGAVLGVLVLTGVSLAGYFIYKEFHKDPVLPSEAIRGRVLLTGLSYTPQLAKSNSKAFHDYESYFCSEVQQILKKALGPEILKSCKILSIDQRLQTHFELYAIHSSQTVREQVHCGLVDTMSGPKRVSINRNEVYFQDNGLMKLHSICAPRSACVSEYSRYSCQCGEGYYRSIDGFDCEDNNECKTMDICPQDCENTEGSYRCLCDKGYEIDKINGVCEDVDECEEYNGGCEHNCENMIGSYKCSCDPGYVLGAGKHHCKDMDECLVSGAKCSHTCRNLVGSYVCTCPDGFVIDSDGLTCSDLDECAESNGGCEGQCFNHIGRFSCNCEAGFELLPNYDSCTDINECLKGISQCSHECINTFGSYKCTCPAGFTIKENSFICENVNECQENNGGCERTCYDSIGSFQCDCPVGFRKSENNEDCLDIDECLEFNGGCSGACENTVGSFNCKCDLGFTPNPSGLDCINLNECENSLLPNGGCEDKCHDTFGSFYCMCSTGWTLSSDQRSCTDVDECISNQSVCGPNSVCRDIIGSYACECATGYTLHPDGRSCIDKNECLDSPNLCEYGCENVEGDFKCACPPGYDSGDGYGCYDINDCDPNPCVHGGCMDMPNDYYCDCSPGWTGKNCSSLIVCPGVRIGTQCYWLETFTPKKNRDDAETECGNFIEGAGLANVKTQFIRDTIVTYLTDHVVDGSSDNAWIALRDYTCTTSSCPSNDWYWNDGEPLGYEDWSPLGNQPNGKSPSNPSASLQDCVIIDGGASNRAIAWQDKDCSGTANYAVCECCYEFNTP